MKLGLFSINMGACSVPSTLVDVARAAEDAGFDSLWAGEHVILPDPQVAPSPMAPQDPALDSLLALGWAAAHTTTIRLATGIIILPQRNPVVLAKELASLDVLSGGRLMFGVGVGYLEPEFTAVGANFAERGAVTDEYLDALDSLMYGEHPSYRGRFVSFDGVDAHPRPVQAPIPVIVGGHSTAAYRRAVRRAQGWYGFALDESGVAACMAGLSSAAASLSRSSALGSLEITVTPRGRLTRERVAATASLGVHRLVPMPRPGGSVEGYHSVIAEAREAVGVTLASSGSGSGSGSGSLSRAQTDELIAYHSHISGLMTAERTSLESALIPVTAYIVVAAAEAWYRHPAMIGAIDDALDASAIGAAGRRPGSQINAVYLWSTANIYLVGRKMLVGFGLVPDDPEPTATMLSFWERAARAYRGDGHRQAWDAGLVLQPYPDGVIASLMAGVRPVTSDDERARIKRWNATVMSYLFLLYFDTRVGTGDSGPYLLPDGRVLLVRDFYRLGPSDFSWSSVASGMPYSYLTAALVLDGVDLKVNDWGTSITSPEDYLDHLVGFGLFTTDGGSLSPVDPSSLDDIRDEVRSTQKALYRVIAGMSRDDKIACGAYVYFTFPRPLAEAAGVADQLDWTVPRDTLDGLYPLLSQISGTNDAPDMGEDYYAPLA